MKTNPIRYSIAADYGHIPVRGNALSSGDDNLDRQVENEILTRLKNRDVWAWATITVTASLYGYEGHAYLGACSYQDAEDFKQPGGYYEQMKLEALEDLWENHSDEIQEEIGKKAWYAYLEEEARLKAAMHTTYADQMRQAYQEI